MAAIGDKGIVMADKNGERYFVTVRACKVGDTVVGIPIEGGGRLAMPLSPLRVGDIVPAIPVSGEYLALRSDVGLVPKLVYSFAEHGTSLAYGGVDYIRFSLDSGATWEEIEISGTVKELGFNSLGVLAISLSSSANMLTIDLTTRVPAGFPPTSSCSQVGSGVYCDSRFPNVLFSYDHCCPVVQEVYNHPGYRINGFRTLPGYGVCPSDSGEPTMVAYGNTYSRAEGVIAGAIQDAESGSGLPTPKTIFYSSEGVYSNLNAYREDNVFRKISTFSFKKMLNIGSGRIFGLYHDLEFGYWELYESTTYGSPPYTSHLITGTSDTAVWACYNRALNEIAVLVNRGPPSNDVVVKYYPGLGSGSIYGATVPNSAGATGTALCLTDSADAWVGMVKNGVSSVQKVPLPRP